VELLTPMKSDARAAADVSPQHPPDDWVHHHLSADYQIDFALELVRSAHQMHDWQGMFFVVHESCYLLVVQ